MRAASLQLKPEGTKTIKTRKVDDHAMQGVAGVLGATLGLVFTLVGIVIVFRVGASVLPTVLTALGDIVTAFATGTTNDTTGDAILNIGGMVIAVVVTIGLIVLFIESAFAFGKQGA